MDIQYWISQALIVLAYIVLGVGLRKEKRIQILKYSSTYQVLLTLSYIILGGIMGTISAIISLLRNILFIYNEKKNKKNSNLILVLFAVITIVLTIIFYKSPIDIFPCILTLVGIYSYWCKNTKVTRIGNILVSVCYIIYAIPLKSWFSVICESYLIINTLIGIFKYEKTNKSNYGDRGFNIFILHSLNGDTLEIWGNDIKSTYGEKEIDVYMPEFPIRAESNYEKFRKILNFYIDNEQLNNNSIVIAHSIGNPYFIRFCKEMNFIPKAYIAVAPGAVYEYPSTRTDYIVEVKKQAYLDKDSLDFVKNNINIKYCLYSDEEDKNIEKFTRFIEDTASEGIYLKGYNHFDGYHRIYKIPELNELISKLL